MAIAGPDYECLYADVGSNGRVNDSGIWNKCALLLGILNGTVELPADGMLQNGENVPYIFLGDDAFALKEFLIKPFPQQGLNEERRIYNYRHSRARRISEFVREFVIPRICSGFWLPHGEFFLVLSILSRNTWKIASLPHLLSITF